MEDQGLTINERVKQIQKICWACAAGVKLGMAEEDTACGRQRTELEEHFREVARIAKEG